MKRFLSVSAVIMAAALTVASAANAQVASLPAPPTASNNASSTIFDAMLSIARAVTSNPSAAQTATISYNAAIQQYNAGDLSRARLSALQAISQTAAVPLPQPSIYAPPIPQQTFLTMPNVVSANQADAEGYVALARRALTSCGGPNTTIPTAVTQNYLAAVDDVVARHYTRAATTSNAVINACSAASSAYAAQQAALPLASPTPLSMASYSPLPIATYGPDPALQQAPAAAPTATPTPDSHRRFKL